jgi:hypothetical protein
MALLYGYTGSTNLEAISLVIWYDNSQEVLLGALFYV